MEDKAERKKIRKIAADLLCEENLAFLDLYDELKAAKSAGERVKVAKKLLDRHVRADSPMEVNLEHKTRVTLEAMGNRLERGLLTDSPLDVWDMANKEVRGMVMLTILPAYLKKGNVKIGQSPKKRK